MFFHLWIVLLLFPVTLQAQSEASQEGPLLEIPGKGFSMKAPSGWEVKQEHGGSSLYMQAPRLPNDVFQRNIRVMTFRGSSISTTHQ